MGKVSYFFAGGGTGGHIYPLLAVAEQVQAEQPDAEIHFFHSTRAVDQRVFEKTGFGRTPLPATGLYAHPVRLLRFAVTFQQSCRIAMRQIARRDIAVVVGAGGFVAGPVCRAGRKLGVPVALLNVDIIPGRANRLSARWADEIFVQFEESKSRFPRTRAAMRTVGCPLRSRFLRPDPKKAAGDLGLDSNKHVLLVTGASSGSTRINEAVCRLLAKLEAFADRWQIVHLTGLDNYQAVLDGYRGTRLSHKVLDYYDGMADLLAAGDLVIGRSGAVSVAEYAVAGVPSICLPYPFHKDRHQYLNAGKLTEVGAAVIVDDVADADDRVGRLWKELEPLMSDDARRRRMAEACKRVARPDAAAQIAARLLEMARRSQPAGIGGRGRSRSLTRPRNLPA
ncbi:MAG TPA: UDP-N-acetylglucosamine--N-acetylmuramyl-(pentapeptide) pyrophosphoryl-undecaprenol N-acetylglucosamine transferase [Sedimentisphaerales bacterium]|nr:UDP-N-acetylglucosamine--N-acetylmuramyl-(pentapeptide) pyrophosphoryl-undecaprenol N-acetylglucosamine transferase [Sedimentisphaerales bacterium]